MTERTKSRLPSLRMQYPAEYTCWRGMRARVKKARGTIHPQFASFDQFFAILGPKENPSDTLDRIDAKDTEYSPENCRWASKSLQTRNRRNTVMLEYTGNALPQHRGKTLSRAEWAALTGQKQSTLRSRQHAGWSCNEIIEGRRKRPPKAFQEMTIPELLDYQPWDAERAQAQEACFLDERKNRENRFEFMLRIVREEHLDRIRRRYRSTAFYLPEEDERNKFEEQRGDLEGLREDWGRKRGAPLARWKELLASYAAHEAKYLRVKAEHEEWKKALSARKVEQQRSDLRKTTSRELTDRYARHPSSGRSTQAPRPIDDVFAELDGGD